MSHYCLLQKVRKNLGNHNAYTVIGFIGIDKGKVPVDFYIYKGTNIAESFVDIITLPVSKETL